MTAYTNKRKTRKEEEKDRLNQMTGVQSLKHTHVHTDTTSIFCYKYFLCF